MTSDSVNMVSSLQHREWGDADNELGQSVLWGLGPWEILPSPVPLFVKQAVKQWQDRSRLE